MVNNKFLDEITFPIAWRFNSCDCNLTKQDIDKIVFLTKDASERLWRYYFCINNLMEINSDIFLLDKKIYLNFEDDKSCADFFNANTSDAEILFFFWGKFSSAIVKKDVFIKSWDDFFYPSDENSLLLIPNTKKIIFSFNETFFCGTLK